VEDLDRFLTEKSTAVSLFVDIHIYFPLYDLLAFKTLANSYLEFNDYKLFSQVEDIFLIEASFSSDEISKLMIANWNLLSRAIKLVISMLQTNDDRRGVEKIGSRFGNNVTLNTHLFFLKKKKK
jgi:hypothetical protein